MLVFGFSQKALAKCMPTRIGQCVMTCPTSAVFDGLPDTESRIPLGKHLRYFGDGFQKSKLLDGKRYWRIPVMDGEFLVQEDVGTDKGVGGGNIIIQTQSQTAGLAAARRAVEALANVDGVIAPFPGGVARSGSKVGSRYKGLPASTADAFCPTLRGRVESKLHPDANCAYEVVIDGISERAVAEAMTAAIRAAAAEDVVAIDLRGKSPVADHMIIASGRSARQVAAIAEKLIERFKAQFGRSPRVEGKEAGDWVLIDAGDVIIHVFRPEVRAFYQLEKMWMEPADIRARAAASA